MSQNPDTKEYIMVFNNDYYFTATSMALSTSLYYLAKQPVSHLKIFNDLFDYHNIKNKMNF